ncbi:hypothetical protein SCP_1004580 [Sparassis crispa]|uniref:Amine oxidase n=1 Tax=Sparassis crispa TaxID=139825 RepID=A0A401GYD9_9APHY|nr:hypothetical protein SCP_1004580 [Sparassis crispa]GBE87211.1 hypothetical protein SCP_1004580 [Sparassis crispa]
MFRPWLFLSFTILELVGLTFERPLTISQTILSVSEGTSLHGGTKVLILGGGVAGVSAARALHEQGISDFIILEARDQLGGRMMSHTFGVQDKNYTVEVGANWIQGTRSVTGTENPIWSIAKKHNVATRTSHYSSSLTTYDDAGLCEFWDIFKASSESFKRLIASAGSRAPKRLVDMSARSGYSLTGSRPDSRHAMAAEYYRFDWEFAATPEDTSWLASSWAHNNTFRPDAGGFSPENLLAVDQRGFKTLIQAEAESFLQPHQLRLNSTVSAIWTAKHGVQVVLTSGETLTADYALCTFSLGVLQNDDIQFVPELPAWKQEAIHSMTMSTYTKIFLQFPQKFWFDTEMALYADHERGRYPVWQSLDHEDFFPGSGIIFVTVTGEFSKRVESMPDSHVKSEVLSVLQSMYPNTCIPEPLDFYFQRWHSDPLFHGSYSNWPASFMSEHQGNLRATVEERLWFAGEATSKKYFGYLHGAYYEGQDIGRRLAECVKGGGCVTLKHIEWVQNARPYDAMASI